MSKARGLSKNQKKQVSKMLTNKIKAEAELKFHEERWVVNAEQTGTVANAIYRITNITQGVQDSQRVGDECKPVFVRVRICAETNQTDPEPACVRAVLFQWHQDSGRDAPDPAEVFMGNALGTIYAPLSEMNHDDRRQFSVLSDKIFTIGKNGADNAIKVLTLSSRRMRKLKFRAATQQGNEHLYLAVLSSRAAGLNQEPILNCSARVQFTDL